MQTNANAFGIFTIFIYTDWWLLLDFLLKWITQHRQHIKLEHYLGAHICHVPRMKKKCLKNYYKQLSIKLIHFDTNVYEVTKLCDAIFNRKNTHRHISVKWMTFRRWLFSFHSASHTLLQQFASINSKQNKQTSK